MGLAAMVWRITADADGDDAAIKGNQGQKYNSWKQQSLRRN